MSHWVYVIECSNHSYYTGYTTDLERRYQEHCQGSAKCKYTRAFKPIRLVRSWQFETKSEALRFEHYVKALPRAKKEQLIQQDKLCF